MTPTEIPMFVESVMQLADALGGKAPTQAGLKVWIQVLREFPLPEIIDQLDGWAKRSNKMPAPADVWKVCNERRIDRLEASAAAERNTFSAEAKRAFQRNDALGKKLRTLAATVREQPSADAKDWARIIVHRFINNLPANNGGPITLVQIEAAAKALNRTVADLYADRDAVTA